MGQLDCPIRFARHNFENLQSLIRFADAKGGAVAAFILASAASAVAMVPKGVACLKFDKPFPSWLPDAIFLVAWICFFVISVITITWLILQVIFPRRAGRGGGHASAGQHLYWEHIRSSESDDEYYEAVSKMNEDGELRNITDQIRQLAVIVDSKMSNLARLKKPLLSTVVSWIVGTLISIWLLYRG